MIKFQKYFCIIFILLSSVSCERYKDTFLIVKVSCGEDRTAINNIRIDVIKRKESMIYGYKELDSYKGYSDDQGICRIYIENYDRDKYSYSISVNSYENTPPDFGGYTYSKWGTVLEENQLKDTLKVSLTKIPIP